MTAYESGYTDGEAITLLAPLVGADPADIAEWAVVAISDHQDGPAIRVASSETGNRRIVHTLAAAIAELSSEPGDDE